MPAPATIDDLLDLVQKSGVVDEARLKAHIQKLNESSAVPTEPSKLARVLVRDGLLTYFQAEQLLQGKWKRFTIGKYKVLERIGAGGMGQVFLCEHKLMRRRVAVKVLPTVKAEDPASRDRFYREARAVAAVDHPNLVRAYDIDQDENLHFLVMEYVDGTNLHDLVKKFGSLNTPRACHYIYGAAVGLQHAHEMGLVHRDIKPGNILVDRSGVVKILDMGLARFFHDEDDVLTKKYNEDVLGTADYLSPEQAVDSHSVDIRADIYSLGATFYFLLAGNQPFPEGTVAQKLIWHQHRGPRPIQQLRPDLPDALTAIIEKMMAKDAGQRYQTPAEVMAALAPWVTTPIPPPEDRELPQLSPAALGTAPQPSSGRGTGQPQRPVPTPAPVTMSHSPTVVAATGRPPSAADPIITPMPAPADPRLTAAVAPTGDGMWEHLTAETEAVAVSDTTQPGGSGSPVPERVPAKSARPAWVPVAIIASALVVLGCCVAAIYLLFFNKQPPPVTPPIGGTTPGHRLVVSRAAAGAENAFPTLTQALKHAAPGDTIVIAEERLQEPPIKLDKARVKDLTIESGLPGGRAAVIECASPGGPVLFDLAGVENVRVRNLEFDGKGMAEVGVGIIGNCPGVTFENVTVRGVKVAGFRLQGAVGEPNRPVTLDRVRVILSPTTDAGIVLTARGGVECRRVAICHGRIEGPGKAGIKFDGPAGEIEVSGNRLFNLDDAFVFGRVPHNRAVGVELTQNTISDVKVGLLFEPPLNPGGKFDLTVTRNYFARTGMIARVGAAAAEPKADLQGLVAEDNGYDKQTHPGNVTIDGQLVGELPVTHPDDAGFLKFPGGNNPEVGPGNVRVGAR